MENGRIYEDPWGYRISNLNQVNENCNSMFQILKAFLSYDSKRMRIYSRTFFMKSTLEWR